MLAKHQHNTRNLSSSIQTILLVLEFHQILRIHARGLYRQSGISPCLEDTIIQLTDLIIDCYLCFFNTTCTFRKLFGSNLLKSTKMAITVLQNRRTFLPGSIGIWISVKYFVESFSFLWEFTLRKESAWYLEMDFSVFKLSFGGHEK